MEMLFFIAPLSLLWPDGIREHPEAVKANTSKKKKGWGAGGCNRSNQGVDRPAGKRSKKKMWRKQNTGEKKKVDFLFLEQRVKCVFFSPSNQNPDSYKCAFSVLKVITERELCPPIYS